MLTYIHQFIRARANHHAKAVFRSTRVIGSSFLEQIDRLTRIGHAFLKSLGKGWSFFKDIHFGWYVLVPVISSTSAFGEAAAILAWGSVVVFLLALIVFAVLDSLFVDEASPVAPSAAALAHAAGTVPGGMVTMPGHRSRPSYEPRQSRWTRSGLRRSAVRRAPRSRNMRS